MNALSLAIPGPPIEHKCYPLLSPEPDTQLMPAQPTFLLGSTTPGAGVMLPASSSVTSAPCSRHGRFSSCKPKSPLARASPGHVVSTAVSVTVGPCRPALSETLLSCSCMEAVNYCLLIHVRPEHQLLTDFLEISASCEVRPRGCRTCKAEHTPGPCAIWQHYCQRYLQ